MVRIYCCKQGYVSLGDSDYHAFIQKADHIDAFLRTQSQLAFHLQAAAVEPAQPGLGAVAFEQIKPQIQCAQEQKYRAQGLKIPPPHVLPGHERGRGLGALSHGVLRRRACVRGSGVGGLDQGRGMFHRGVDGGLGRGQGRFGVCECVLQQWISQVASPVRWG